MQPQGRSAVGALPHAGLVTIRRLEPAEARSRHVRRPYSPPAMHNRAHSRRGRFTSRCCPMEPLRWLAVGGATESRHEHHQVAVPPLRCWHWSLRGRRGNGYERPVVRHIEACARRPEGATPPSGRALERPLRARRRGGGYAGLAGGELTSPPLGPVPLSLGLFITLMPGSQAVRSLQSRPAIDGATASAIAVRSVAAGRSARPVYTGARPPYCPTIRRRIHGVPSRSSGLGLGPRIRTVGRARS